MFFDEDLPVIFINFDKMSSIGTGYDLYTSQFSPDGRVFQVEYAHKAVENSGTAIALVSFWNNYYVCMTYGFFEFLFKVF